MTEQRLFDVAAIPVAPRIPVLAFDPSRHTNGMRVMDLARLGYLPEPVLDPTFGPGGMWSVHRPLHLVGCDIDPQRAPDAVCDYRQLPFRAGTFGSCVLDPPYKLTGDRNQRADGYGDLNARFGTVATRRAWTHIDAAIHECSRVTRHVLVVKCQDQIESEGYVWQTGDVVATGRPLGWKLEAMVHLVNYIQQPADRPQVHPRNNYSTFVVLAR